MKSSYNHIQCYWCRRVQNDKHCLRCAFCPPDTGAVGYDPKPKPVSKYRRTKRKRRKFTCEAYKMQPCGACNRWPDEHDEPRCVFCPEDQVGCRACLKHDPERQTSYGGLCRDCYRVPAIRNAMPRRRYRRKKGLAECWDSDHWQATQSGPKTEYKPGSEAKIDVLKGRLWRGEMLHVQGDAGQVEFTAETVHDFLELLGRAMNQAMIAGVYETPGGRWRAYPWDADEGKHIHLKTWPTEAEAIAAVIKWRRSHGKQAPPLPEWFGELQAMVRDCRAAETLTTMHEKETGGGRWQDEPEPNDDDGWLERAIADMKVRLEQQRLAKFS